MKRQFNKAVAVATSAALLLSSAMPVFGAERAIDRFTDVSGHWAVSDLSSMAERGIMGGYPDNTMRPQQSVTMAESVKLINKALELKGSGDVSLIKYSDVKKDAWYSGEVAIAIENGYLSKVAPGEKLNPNAPATREQLSSMFAQAMELKAKDLASLDKFKDSAKISASFKADMAAAVEKGLFGGYEDETIRPSEKVIRATMAAVANRTILDRELEKTQGIVLGANDMLVDSNGVTVSGKTVDTLWISPVKGEGVIVLENINAKKVVIKGDNTQVEIKSTTAAVKERRAKVAETGSLIGEIEIFGAKIKLSVGKGSKITLLTIKPEAKQAVIEGATSTVEKVVIAADNVKFEIVGAKFEVAKEVTGSVINGQSVSADTTGSVTTEGIKKDSSGGGGGGGGGVAPTPVKNTYAFVASKDGSDINIVEKQYYGTDMMSFVAVSGVYSAIGALDSTTIDSHVSKAMPTVKEILNLENESHVKYVKVLDDTIKAYAGNDLTVFTKNGTVAGYISAIAAGTDVDNKMNLLTKALLKSGLDSILADLGKLFPNSTIPSNISVKTIKADGTLETLSGTLLSAAKSTIDSKLGAVTFDQATGKTVVEIGANGKTISLEVKKMS